MAAGETLCFKFVFRPEQPREHSFSLPLSLEGIPSEGAKGLRVPVSAVGLIPTLTFVSTEVDFGRRVVSRDPCSLKQYQGEFVLKNASEKARGYCMPSILSLPTLSCFGEVSVRYLSVRKLVLTNCLGTKREGKLWIREG